MERIPIAGPWITQLEVDYAAEAAEHGWYERAGEWPQQFENAFADYLGVKHAVSLPSCTSGLHLALAALEIGPGDEVIVPELTWIASAAPVSYVGASPVFADVDEATWCLSAESLETCITPRTKAVIPVDLYGGTPDWEAICAVCQKHGLAIVEDAAEAIGSESGGCKAGSFGDAGTFSFHGSKTFTTGEGGMLVTDRDDLNERVRFLRDHGRPPGDRMFFNTEVAFKYKMPPVAAAIGCAQVKRAEELVARKREIFSWYREGLSDCGVTLNHEPEGTRNTYWMVTALAPADGPDKAKLMAAFAVEGIDSRPMFHPLSSLPAYADADGSGNCTAYSLSPRGINLPSALCLERTQVDRVCTVFKKALAG